MKLLFHFLLYVPLIFITACQYPETNNQDQELITLEGASSAIKTNNSQRYGMVIELKADKVKEYKELHENAWPGVLKQLSESNIQNYSIFLHKIEGKYYLFSYFEYVGDDYERDMEKMAADSTTLKWWELTDSYQIPLDLRKEGELWAEMEEVFYMD